MPLPMTPAPMTAARRIGLRMLGVLLGVETSGEQGLRGCGVPASDG
jgi:hypothetical protein